MRVQPHYPLITLLYADFPGLGRRWEDDAQETARRLFRAHDRFTETVAAHGGQPVPAWLDARCASFASPAVAVAAALAFQCPASHGDDLFWSLALASGSAGRAGVVSVPLLHRVRLLAESGRRNQVLLAASTAELVAAYLPPDIRLVELGTYRFSDQAAEYVFQILASEQACGNDTHDGRRNGSEPSWPSLDRVLALDGGRPTHHQVLTAE